METYALLLLAVAVLVLQTLLHAVDGRAVARVGAAAVALGHGQDLLVLGPRHELFRMLMDGRVPEWPAMRLVAGPALNFSQL